MADVDSVTTPGADVPPAVLQKSRRIVLVIGGVAYAAFACWCAFLLAALPDPTGQGGSLVSIGILSSAAGVLGLLGVGAFALKRISSSPSSIATRRRSLIKLIAVIVPGVLLGVATPFSIMREPTLPLDIVAPTEAADFVAPVAVTLSAERAAAILKNMGLRAVKYQWDTDGDGKMNDETILPTTTVVYERQGTYTAVVRVQVDGSTVRRIARRVVIPQSVFSVVPIQPEVQKAVKFSVATLLTDPKLLKQVQWDFGDGNPVQTTTSPDIAHTYYAVGAYPVSAVMQLTNNSQITYKRTITVKESTPLPFPITLSTEPKTLIGPTPFGVIFRLETAQELQEISWSFGDGKEDRGPALLRESHQFDGPGIYSVIVRARATDGQVAELTSIVRVTDVLQLRDVQFDGTAVQAGKIQGDFAVLADRDVV
jgi:hypothetical protein